MRTVKPSTRGQLIRTQERMDQNYIANVARSVMGELEISIDDLEKHPQIKDFSRVIFGNVLHHIKGWNSETLGKITAYGLGDGETTTGLPVRVTSLQQAWWGSPFETSLSGAMILEWTAATTIVAAIYDLLSARVLIRTMQAAAHSGGKDGFSIHGVSPDGDAYA